MPQVCNLIRWHAALCIQDESGLVALYTSLLVVGSVFVLGCFTLARVSENCIVVAVCALVVQLHEFSNAPQALIQLPAACYTDGKRVVALVEVKSSFSLRCRPFIPRVCSFVQLMLRWRGALCVPLLSPEASALCSP